MLTREFALEMAKKFGAVDPDVCRDEIVFGPQDNRWRIPITETLQHFDEAVMECNAGVRQRTLTAWGKWFRWPGKRPS